MTIAQKYSGEATSAAPSVFSNSPQTRRVGAWIRGKFSYSKWTSAGERARP